MTIVDIPVTRIYTGVTSIKKEKKKTTRTQRFNNFTEGRKKMLRCIFPTSRRHTYRGNVYKIMMVIPKQSMVQMLFNVVSVQSE